MHKSKDKYPILAHGQSNTISKNENNFKNYTKNSSIVKLRNNTENNYPSNYQPTNVTSGYSSYIKTYAPSLDINNNNYSKTKTKRRPFSSKQHKIKKEI